MPGAGATVTGELTWPALPVTLCLVATPLDGFGRKQVVGLAFGIGGFAFDQVGHVRGDELGPRALSKGGLPFDGVQVTVGPDDPQWSSGVKSLASGANARTTRRSGGNGTHVYFSSDEMVPRSLHTSSEMPGLEPPSHRKVLCNCPTRAGVSRSERMCVVGPGACSPVPLPS